MPESTAAPGDSDAALRRVGALLAKAESTDFPAEADALIAKAQELIARHAIDTALLGQYRGGQVQADAEAIVRREVPLRDPYARQQFSLYSRIASLNRCEAAYIQHARVIATFGTRADLDAVDLLFTSLLVQATRAMIDASPPSGLCAPSTVAAFRRSFLAGFAHRVWVRLKDANEVATWNANRDGVGDALPILARREDAARRAMEADFPRLGRMRTAASDPSGIRAGVAAADRADLGTEPSLPHPPSSAPPERRPTLRLV